jgi:hypothetical protein
MELGSRLRTLRTALVGLAIFDDFLVAVVVRAAGGETELDPVITAFEAGARYLAPVSVR